MKDSRYVPHGPKFWAAPSANYPYFDPQAVPAPVENIAPLHTAEPACDQPAAATVPYTYVPMAYQQVAPTPAGQNAIAGQTVLVPMTLAPQAVPQAVPAPAEAAPQPVSPAPASAPVDPIAGRENYFEQKHYSAIRKRYEWARPSERLTYMNASFLAPGVVLRKAILAGFVGADRFVTGNPFLAILKLLLCCGGILALVAGALLSQTIILVGGVVLLCAGLIFAVADWFSAKKRALLYNYDKALYILIPDLY